MLVRTIGRATLVEALRSVFSQDFAGTIEVVVVPAHGLPLPTLPEPPSQVSVLVADERTPLARAAAANRALDLASGQSLLFLDDDDLIEPAHLQRLCDALHRAPASPAAYSGVRCLSGGQVVHVYDREVRWNDLLLQNLLPIHAVMFRREVVEREPRLRMEVSLDRFEDWDFWLQLMQRGGDFVRVPGVSAIYRLDAAAGSGHAEEGAARRQALERLAARTAARCSRSDWADIVEAHARAQTNGEQLEQSVQALGAQVDQARSVIADQARRLDEQRLAFDALQSDAWARQEALRADVQGWRDLWRAEADALDAHRRELATVNAELDAHRREVAVLSSVRVDLLADIVRLQADAQALRSSTSWRVTAPLRAAARAAAFVRGGRLMLLLRNVLHAGRAERRRFGWNGTLRRLPRHLAQLGRYARMLSLQATVAPGTFFEPMPPRAASRLHPELAGRDDVLQTRVSVVIPTLDAGLEFDWLVRKLRSQRGVREVEIVVVDSGSTDGTPARAREHGARVVEIAPAEFTHSHARNLGAQAASGEYLLFMVQDAYPIGELWVRALVEYLREHASQDVVAASCAEYARSDSDLMYDCAIATHYRFLGCHDDDRIGSFAGGDHMSLRSMGQLSDVACLIPRDLFMRYRYRGDYAEDLDLGIRLIRDGHKVAMLSSVRVIHSHRRGAYYYLKRSFVDVTFLVALFEDFAVPPCASVTGLVDGACAVAGQLAARALGVAGAAATLSDESRRCLDGLYERLQSGAPAPVPIGDERFDAFLHELAASVDGHRDDAARREARAFVDSFVARVDHLRAYAVSVHDSVDAHLLQEWHDALRKTLAATLGAALAFLYLDSRAVTQDTARRALADRLYRQLKAGV